MNIAIIGLGSMGSRMAKRILDAGHKLFIYNRTKERALPLINSGAIFSETPRETVANADFIISMVTDNEASEAVWLNEKTGAINGLKENSIVIESSTLTTVWIKTLANKVLEKGAEFIEAPVIGSRPQAEAGQLVYLLGGSPTTIEKAEKILSQLGGKQFLTGEIGTATAMKLAVNALFGIQTAALGEILGILDKSGIETIKSLEILNELPITSPAMKRIGGLIADKNFSPNFPIELVAKDFRYVLKNAQDVNANAPISQATKDLYEAASEEFGDDDIAGISQIF